MVAARAINLIQIYKPFQARLLLEAKVPLLLT